MGFTTFKNNYISRVNGEGFATSADCADFIVSEYLGSFNIPTLVLPVPPASDALVEAVNAVLSRTNYLYGLIALDELSQGRFGHVN